VIKDGNTWRQQERLRPFLGTYLKEGEGAIMAERGRGEFGEGAESKAPGKEGGMR